MTYRVLIDYGEVELTAMIWSDILNKDEIYIKALNHLEKEGWTLPAVSPNIVLVTEAPEWDEE